MPHPAAVLLFAATLAPAPSAASSKACATAEEEPRPPCCFTNVRYAGTCEVRPGKDETCASILAYLNNPQSQGKAYCNQTNIRGGWTSVPCGRSATASGPGPRPRGGVESPHPAAGTP
jgi:hypothetical protein